MEQALIENIKALVQRNIGVSVNGSMGKTHPRKEIIFWFSNYNRGNGPVFTIRPQGLSRHLVTVRFGPYSSPCIQHIQENAGEDAYETAYAFTESLAKSLSIKVNGKEDLLGWAVSSQFQIEASRKVSDQHKPDNISETVKVAIIPLMAAMAELIGYEDTAFSEETGDLEGEITEVLIKKRERSPRNRLLCLAIHGEKCFICGSQPNSVYDASISSIIEVHHIEPLAEIDEAKKYNPRTDLIPLCPNCHRAIHKRTPAFRPEELMELLSK
ncbi:Hnh endonuclease [Methylophaga thiooxydans]|uniref:Hnh endonuclease n=1 Tax=Methylophaga thiooxydans TaxID=392484 RepID=A0A0A0BGW8_9GAMM|nr:HNH endonuclease [Methylophaga thiooxydans]KGM06942.1 Hnh endonuclease [Methylophaga thiooxydans]